MTEQDQEHEADEIEYREKSVRRMGTILAVLSWLGMAAGVILIVGVILMRIVIPGDDGWEYMSVDELPKGITAEMTVAEVLEKDRAFLQKHIKRFAYYGIGSGILYFIIAFYLLRIARAWRRGEPFAWPMIQGLRTIGWVMLVQFVVGMKHYIFTAPDSNWSVVAYSQLFDEMLAGFAGGQIGQLEGAILFLTLSWVLQHGRNLKQEQELTV